MKRDVRLAQDSKSGMDPKARTTCRTPSGAYMCFVLEDGRMDDFEGYPGIGIHYIPAG